MALSSDERQRLIESYAAGYDDVLAALEGITPAEWDVREGLGEWSPREVVHHLGDSEMDGAGRIRMIVAEREPRLTGWDADRWAEVLYSSERPVEASLAEFKGACDATLPLLRLLTDEQWRRVGQHSEFGRFSGDDWLAFYGLHAQDHAAQIRRARETGR